MPCTVAHISSAKQAPIVGPSPILGPTPIEGEMEGERQLLNADTDRRRLAPSGASEAQCRLHPSALHSAAQSIDRQTPPAEQRETRTVASENRTAPWADAVAKSSVDPSLDHPPSSLRRRGGSPAAHKRPLNLCPSPLSASPSPNKRKGGAEPLLPLSPSTSRPP